MPAPSAPRSPNALPGLREPIGEETLARVARMDRVTAWIAERVLAETGRRVLEIGAGRGDFTRRLLARPGIERVVAIEPNCDHARQLRRLAEEHPALSVVEADFPPPEGAAPIEEGCDTIVCLNVLEHIADDGAALAEMRQALTPGGRLLLLVPALPALFGTLDVFLMHHRRYRRAELESRLRAAGFRVRRLAYFNLFGMLGWWWNSRIRRAPILPTGQLDLYNRLVPVFRRIETWSGPPIGQSLWAVAER